MNSNPGAGRRAEVLPTYTPGLFAAALERAARLLRAGEVVALPTETVYGLAANAFDPLAVGRIFALKGRPAHNPVIVHVAGGAMARDCVADWPPEAERLAGSFWPGPLTLVLPRSNRIPMEVTAGGGTVGIRWPSHPFIQALIRACGFPLAAPSANRSNEVSPTHAAHVMAALGDRIPLIIDGGSSHVGIESTVVDLTCRPPRVLRPGMIHGESLAAVLGPGGLVDDAGSGAAPLDGGTLRSPGLLPRHYAPRARLVVRAWEDDRELAAHIGALGVDPAKVHVLSYHRIPGGSVAGRVSVIPNDPEAYARALYAEWHHSDEMGAVAIVVERVPEGAAWRGVADRLNRAGMDAGCP